MAAPNVPRYNTPDSSATHHPIRILFTDRASRIIHAIQDEIAELRLSATTANLLNECYQIDYHIGDIVPLALGADPELGDTTGMLRNAAFVSPANSLGHMGGGVDYPLNHIMFPHVADNVKDANYNLAKSFYAAQDRNLRDDAGALVPQYPDDEDEDEDENTHTDDGDIDMLDVDMVDKTTKKDTDKKTSDLGYVEDNDGMWYGPLFNALGMPFMPVGSASISPTQTRDDVPNNLFQFLVSAPTMYSPGSSISGTGNAGAAVFAVLGCVQKYNRLLAKLSLKPITTIVLPGMGTGVGGMTPSEYAREAVGALVEYGKHYLGYHLSAAAEPQAAMPGHMVDLVPQRNRFFLRDPDYFLRMQRPGYSMEDFDMTYSITPRPDPEVERLKSIKPIGGLFGGGNSGAAGGLFDSQFGMLGMGNMDMAMGPNNIGGSMFRADADYQRELSDRLKDEEIEEEEDDLGAEARLLARMADMDSSRERFDEMIRRRNQDTLDTNSNVVADFLRTQDPSESVPTNTYTADMSTDSRYIQQLESRDADSNVNITPLANSNGNALSLEDAQAKFAAMMAERNNLIAGHHVPTDEEKLAAKKAEEEAQVERQRQFEAMMKKQNESVLNATSNK